MTLAIGATREGADMAKSTALIIDNGQAVVFAPGTSPANATQAAREILGERVTFSHLSVGYPVYRAE